MIIRTVQQEMRNACVQGIGKPGCIVVIAVEETDGNIDNDCRHRLGDNEEGGSRLFPILLFGIQVQSMPLQFANSDHQSLCGDTNIKRNVKRHHK
jgi:hypothetical protein